MQLGFKKLGFEIIFRVKPDATSVVPSIIMSSDDPGSRMSSDRNGGVNSYLLMAV